MNITKKVYKNSGNTAILGKILETHKTILDIGCGAGDNAKELSTRGKLVDGITLSEEEANIAKQYLNEVYIYNLENGLPNDVKEKKYDVVICSHVLEHICWPSPLLDDIAKVVSNSNGIFLVALPNIMHYKTRFKLIQGEFNYTKSGIMDETHFRWYTYETAQALLKAHGFSLLETWVDGHIPFYSLLKHLPHGVNRCFKNILFSISKGFFGEQLFYKANIK